MYLPIVSLPVATVDSKNSRIQNMVASETLMTAQEFAFSVNRTLPFDLPQHNGHRVLWMNPDRHVNVVGQQMPFDDFTLT